MDGDVDRIGLVFHESFDSTRGSGPTAPPNLAQAQAEALVSLLLGHQLTLNHSYAFDSRGVLQLVEAVLSARDEVLGTLPAQRASTAAARERVRQRAPFLLTWFHQDGFLPACAGSLRRCNPGKTDDESRFVLSAWQAIDLNPQLRIELADALVADRDPVAPGWVAADEDLSALFEAVMALDRYSREFGRGRKAQEPGTSLVSYLKEFRELGREPALLGNLARASDAPTDIATRLWQEIDGRFQAPKAEETLDKRSWAHEAVRAAQLKGSASLEHFEQVKEFVNTLYNAVLADSAFAIHGFLSSVPRAKGRNELKQVNDLAIAVIKRIRPETVNPPVSGLFTKAAQTPDLPVQPLRVLFRAYWQLVGDDDRWHTWQQSCARVNRLLDKRPADVKPGDRKLWGWTGQLAEAWAGHMELLRRQLPEIVRSNDRALTVRVCNDGGVYDQTQQAAVPTSDQLGDALAAGRYLSHLAHSVKR